MEQVSHWARGSSWTWPPPPPGLGRLQAVLCSRARTWRCDRPAPAVCGQVSPAPQHCRGPGFLPLSPHSVSSGLLGFLVREIKGRVWLLLRAVAYERGACCAHVLDRVLGAQGCCLCAVRLVLVHGGLSRPVDAVLPFAVWVSRQPAVCCVLRVGARLPLCRGPSGSLRNTVRVWILAQEGVCCCKVIEIPLPFLVLSQLPFPRVACSFLSDLWLHGRRQRRPRWPSAPARGASRASGPGCACASGPSAPIAEASAAPRRVLSAL